MGEVHHKTLDGPISLGKTLVQLEIRLGLALEPIHAVPAQVLQQQLKIVFVTQPDFQLLAMVAVKVVAHQEQLAVNPL